MFRDLILTVPIMARLSARRESRRPGSGSALGYPGGDLPLKSVVADREVLRSMIEIGLAGGCWDAARGHAAAGSASLVEQPHMMTKAGQFLCARQSCHARTDDPNPHHEKLRRRQQTPKRSPQAHLKYECASQEPKQDVSRGNQLDEIENNRESMKTAEASFRFSIPL